MGKLEMSSDPRVEGVFDAYPPEVNEKMQHLRLLIIETAEALDGVDYLEETLKWGEPSYLTKKGSTIRIDWKPKHPDQYAIYFKCTSKLVPAFRQVYNSLFNFEGNRAIVFALEDSIPEKELRQCIAAGLTYHSVKKLPKLGLPDFIV